MDKFSSLRSKIYKKSAFTLIEVIISIAILATVSTVGFFAFTSYKGSKNIELTMNELVAVIRDVQKRSITEQDGKQWGLRFINSTSTTHSYETFSGASYSSSSVNSTNPLRRSVAFGNPSEGLNMDTIFSAISGKLGETRIISLISQRRDNLVGDVTMLSQGTITTRLETGVVGYWHLDEATSTAAYDASGNTNTGTLTNSPTWQSVSNCKAGACLSFDGSTQYVNVSTNPIFNVSEITISSWVISDITNAFRTAVSRYDDASPQSGNWMLGHGGTLSKYRFLIRIGSTNYLAESGDGFSTGSWHHLVGTYNGFVIKLYIDGIERASTTIAGSLSSNAINIRIGNRFGNTQYWDGKIDEVRIYNRALSATEILNHYNDLK